MITFYNMTYEELYNLTYEELYTMEIGTPPLPDGGYRMSNYCTESDVFRV